MKSARFAITTAAETAGIPSKRSMLLRLGRYRIHDLKDLRDPGRCSGERHAEGDG